MKQNRDEARILSFLGRTDVTISKGEGARAMLENAEGRVVAVEISALRSLHAKGLVDLRDNVLRRVSVETSEPCRRNAARETREIIHKGYVAHVTVDADESPLSAVARRKARDGDSFLTAGEFNAGERLRADYTRGQIMPRLGANWTAAVTSGRRSGGAGGVAEMTDAAMGARQRVEHALDAVGPELSGVLVDICCFLKGVEQVEIERGWPVRSAKIVLKQALSRLARHYDPSIAPARRRMVHWGAEGYRPKL